MHARTSNAAPRTVLTSGVFCRDFIGRAADLARLRAAVARDARSSAVVVVRGEAGVGKSRIAHELAAVVAEGGLRTIAAPVHEFANAPYATVLHLLRLLGRDVALARESGADADGGEKLRRFEEVAAAFGAAAREGAPLVVVVEDLHWADAGTVELLRFLAGRLASEPLTLLVTYRIEDPDVEPARLRALAALEREAADVLTLAPLRDDEIDAMLRRALAESGHTFPAPALARIRELAEGRPLFAEELLRGALERRDREGTLVAVPPGFLVTVRERFGALEPSDRDVLLYAAVVGRRFSASFVGRLADSPQARTLAALRRARDLQLVVEEDDERGDRFAFRHALTREAIYDQLLRAETRALHARVAEALAHEPVLDVPAIAEHAWRAGDVEHGIAWNERAGDAAAALFAHADAARHYTRASEIASERAQRAMLAEKAAEAFYATGDVAAAIERFAAAMEALGDGPERHRLALRRSYLLFDQGRTDEGVREALAVVEQLGDEDSALRFNAETMAAGLLTVHGRPGEALEHLQRAETLAARRAAGAAQRFEGIYAYALGLVGRAAEARVRFAVAERAAREAGDSDVLMRALNNHGTVELRHGTVDEARRLYDECVAVASATNTSRFVAWGSQNAALAALLSGDIPAAARWELAVAPMRHLGGLRRWPLATTLRIATLTGDGEAAARDEAVAELDAAAGEWDPPATSTLAGALALSLLRAGDEEGARRVVARAARLLPAPEPPFWLVDAVARCGDPELRATAIGVIVAAAELEGASSARGVLALARAREAQRHRRRAEAVQLAEEAAAAFRAAGWRIDEAFALEAAGRTAEAVALFRACGAGAEVRRLTAAAGGSRRRGDATLTAREREIALLVAAGRPARAIAEALVISERTVETHIAAVYRKLGITSRAQLAGLLGETTAERR